MIAFIEGGMTLPMGRITRDYLLAHRVCPHQCAPNMFRILGCIVAFNEHLRLRITWHDVVHMYEFHSQANGGFYLKSRLAVVRLISCLPKSNKGMKDDYLIIPGERARWDTLELGSLEKHFKSCNLHYIVITHYLHHFNNLLS